MTFIQFVLRILALTDFSSSIKHIEYVTKTYFSGETLLFVYWNNVSMEFRDEIMDYWTKSGIVIVETCNSDYVTDDIIWERSYVQNIVVLFGDMVPERHHIESMRQCRSWNARSKILIVVNSADLVNRTLEIIWTLTKAINVTVMVSAPFSVRYYTSYPYDDFKVVEVDLNGLFTPKPLNNLHGSVISVSTTHVEPYIAKPKIQNNYTEGLEIRIINCISRKLNFYLHFMNPPDGQSPWVRMSEDRRKVLGSLGLLYRCEADIVFHGIPPSIERSTLSDLTTVHTIDYNVWAVPVRPFSFNWKSIIKLFKMEVWGLIWLILILIAVTLYLVVKYEFGSPKTSFNIFDAFFQSFGIHLEASIYFYRKRQVYRLFIFMISCYAMIIVASYESSLIMHLTTPGSENQYNTIEEAMDDGLLGQFFSPSKSLFNLTDHDLWNRILAPGKHFYSNKAYDILRDIAYNKTIFSFFTYSFANFIIHRDNLFDENHESRIRILPEYYNEFLVAMYTSKGHPLRDVIANDIMRLQEGGILTQWMKEILADCSKVGKVATSSEIDDGPMALTMEHLKGAFYIIPLMFCIGGVAFIGEVVYYWWNFEKFDKSSGIKKSCDQVNLVKCTEYYVKENERL